jgi:hypothetical protein
MAKVAKLVMVSLMTRVIVDENATDEEIISASYKGFQAKLDNRELGDNLESIEDDEELPYGSVVEDASECPVCNRSQYVRPDFDSPDSMNCCDACGSEWVVDGVEITLDARDELSPEEIAQRGYNPL